MQTSLSHRTEDPVLVFKSAHTSLFTESRFYFGKSGQVCWAIVQNVRVHHCVFLHITSGYLLSSVWNRLFVDLAYLHMLNKCDYRYQRGKECMPVCL